MKHQMLLMFLTLIMLTASCQKECDELETYDYELALEDGLYVEKFAADITDENRYNSNNEIFTICKSFIYDYYYENNEGERQLIEREPGREAFEINNFAKWFFVPENEPNKRTVSQVKIEVGKGLEPFIDISPDYNQTIIKFSSIQNNGRIIQLEETGAIENEKNVWMHPPRFGLFAMLEFAPFPFIQAPYEIGNTWVFDYIRISGENWSDPRWLEFEGQINIVSTYEITDFKTIDTAFGALECYEITGVATQPYGSAQLIAYFNDVYGFVKLDYTNIDQTKMVLELVEVEQK